jgi:adenine C2-methylase RlmN of 23S rRNA A2503 and tRNA A37
MKSIYSLTPDDLISQCPSIKISHARKLISYCFRHGHYPDKIIPNITKDTYELVKATDADTHFEILEKLESTVDTFIKYAFKSYDGSVIESVRIPLENPNRFVVSSITVDVMG